MLIDRVLGAFAFRQGVYEEVEHDTSFTATAWMLVAVSAFLNSLGMDSADTVFGLAIGALLSSVLALVGFAVATFIISSLGKAVFDAKVSFDEVVRSLGLAYVWNGVAVLGIVSNFSDLLSCMVAPITIGAFLLGLLAWLVAAREALDLDWGPTIVLVGFGWMVVLTLKAFAGILLVFFEFGRSALGELFGIN